MSNVILVTGAAGFIGSHVAEALARRSDMVVGLDNFDDYYDSGRKWANVREIEEAAGGARHFHFIAGDVRDRELVGDLFAEHRFTAVVHLAAMAGVRNSIIDPGHYYDVNLFGTLVLLDAAAGRLPFASSVAAGPRPNFVFASTSSVYGATRQIPFRESDPCDRPLAPYSASKRAAELLGHTYHHLHGLPFTALRFFTVYGPRGRPDMMTYKVADSIFLGRDVPLCNGGQLYRDWTYIDDIVKGVVAAIDRPLGYEVINLGRGEPVLLTDYVRLIEARTARKARLVSTLVPETEIPYTYAELSKARQLLGYQPTVSVEQGVAGFLDWYERQIRGKAE